MGGVCGKASAVATVRPRFMGADRGKPFSAIGTSGKQQNGIVEGLPEQFYEKYSIVMKKRGREGQDGDEGEEQECPEEIGHGAYSKVYKATLRSDPEQIFAVKYVSIKRLTGLRGSEKAKQILKEVRRGVKVLQNLSHPNIISIEDCFESSTAICVVLEYAPGGELYNHIVQRGFLTEREASNFVRQVVLATKFMHEQNVVHRDLKPENLVLGKVPEGDEEISLKIIDFGFSRVITAPAMNSFVGTLNYVAPEILLRNDYDNKVDIWSIGCITYVLLVGYLPFDREANHGADEIEVEKIYFDQEDWQTISVSAKAFIIACLNRDPADRPTAESLLTMAWLDPATHSAHGSRLQSPQKMSNMTADGMPKIAMIKW